MKKFKKTMRMFCFVLSFLLLLSGMVGCSNNNSEILETQETSTNAPDDGSIKIVNAGVAVYTVVYPDNASTTVKNALNRLVQAIQEETGILLETKTDYLKRGALYDSSTLEILFGRTDYEESKTAIKNLEDDQFAIQKINNKIVFVSPQDKNLEVAVDYFCEYLLKPNTTTDAEGRKTLRLQEYVSQHVAVGTNIKIGEIPISDFVIVYEAEREGYKDIAKQLQSLIEEVASVKLQAYADTREIENENQILIGKTNREFSQKLYEEKSPKLMTYEVIVEQSNVQILCGGPYSARECVDYLRFSIGSLTKDGSYFKTNLAPDSATLTAGSDLRIMSLNVLAAKWGEDLNDGSNYDKTPDASQRAEILAALLVNYQPDVVGLQEADKKWINYLPTYLEILKNDYGLEYSWEFEDYEGYETLTSTLYRSDKFKIVESDGQSFSWWIASKEGYHMRLMTWMYLQNKTDANQKFVFLNTHWALSEDKEAEGAVAACMNEQIALVNKLRTNYNVPVICTGDYNNNQEASEYATLCEKAALFDTQKLSKANGTLVNEGGGCGSIGSVRGSTGKYIDHIFVSSGCSSLRYETIVGNRAYWMSDHSPHIADVKLN